MLVQVCCSIIVLSQARFILSVFWLILTEGSYQHSLQANISIFHEYSILQLTPILDREFCLKIALKFAHFLQFVKAKTLENSSIWLISIKLIKWQLNHPKRGHLYHFEGRKRPRSAANWWKITKIGLNWLEMAQKL